MECRRQGEWGRVRSCISEGCGDGGVVVQVAGRQGCVCARSQEEPAQVCGRQYCRGPHSFFLPSRACVCLWHRVCPLPWVWHGRLECARRLGHCAAKPYSSMQMWLGSCAKLQRTLCRGLCACIVSPVSPLRSMLVSPQSCGRAMLTARGACAQVEKQLQVGLQVGREKTQKLSQLQNNIQIINRVLTKISILHSWGECTMAAGDCSHAPCVHATVMDTKGGMLVCAFACACPVAHSRACMVAPPSN